MKVRDRFSLLGVIIAFPFSLASFAQACELRMLVGLWGCAGAPCTPGGSTSTLYQRPDGQYIWRDGVGSEGLVLVNGDVFTVRFPGGPFTGKLETCSRIRWSANHVDSKTDTPVEGPNAKPVIWRGWAKITPCSKLVSPGFPHIPYVKFADQELHTEITANVPSPAQLMGHMQQCAGIAIASCALTVQMGCFPAFKAAWGACMAARVSGITGDVLEIRTYPKCLW